MQQQTIEPQLCHNSHLQGDPSDSTQGKAKFPHYYMNRLLLEIRRLELDVMSMAYSQTDDSKEFLHQVTGQLNSIKFEAERVVKERMSPPKSQEAHQ